MSDEKTTTERLRVLLDARGVEWKALSGHQMGEFTITATQWHDRDGGLVTMCISEPHGSTWDFFWIPTPEQAIEATLGRGTCRKVREWEDDPRGGGGWVLVCSECDEILANDGEDGEFDGPNYCPNCGRRVANEQ